MATGNIKSNLTIYIDNTAAQQALQTLKTQAALLQQKISEIQKSGGDATKELQRLAQTDSQIKALTNTLDKGLNKSLRDMQNELRQVESQLKRATDPADINRLQGVWASLKKQTDAARTSILQIGEAQKAISGKSIAGGLAGGFGLGALFGGIATAVTFATGAVANLVKESFQLALEAEGVKKAFDRINAPGLLDNLRDATHGTITDLELMKKAVQYNNFNLPLSQLGTLLEFARQRAAATGGSVEDLTNAIVTGLGRQSSRILVNLGISAQTLHDEMKKTGDMATAVMNIVNRQMAQMGTQTDIAADKLARYHVVWDNIKEAVGGAWRATIVGASDFVAWLDKIDYRMKAKSLRDEIDNQKAMDEARKQVSQMILTNKEGADKLREGAQIPKASIAALKDEIKVLTTQMETMTIGSKQFIETRKEVNRLQAELDAAMGKPNKKDDAAAKKILDDRKKLMDELERLQIEYDHRQDDAFQKEITRTELKYRELDKLAHGDAELTKALEQQKNMELLDIQNKYLLKYDKILNDSLAAKIRATAEASKKMQEEMTKDVNKGLVNVKKEDLQNLKEAIARLNDLTKQPVDIFNVKKVKSALEAQRDMELDLAEKTGKSKADILAKYDALIKKSNKEAIVSAFDLLAEITRRVQNAFDGFAQAANNRDDQELQRDTDINNKKKQNLDEQLKHKLITQQQHDRQVAELDADLAKKQAEIKQREFKRQQIESIMQVIINSAEGVSKIIAQSGVLAPLFIAIEAATIAGQIALIKSQQPPSYGEGGKLNGPKHSKGGMPVINPVTGEINAYLEGGEGVLKARAMSSNKIYTATGTPSQIASALNSAHGGTSWNSGATLTPKWMTYPPTIMNIPKILRSIETVRMYSSGGVFQYRNRNEKNSQVVIGHLTGESQVSINESQFNALLIALDKRIRAYVSLKDINDQQDRMNNIKNSATLRG